MDKNLFQNLTVTATVFLLHLVVLSAVWRTSMLPENNLVESMVLVDLGALGGGATAIPQAAAAAQSAPPQEQSVQKKAEQPKADAVKTAARKVSAVKTQRADADFAEAEKTVAKVQKPVQKSPAPQNTAQPSADDANGRAETAGRRSGSSETAAGNAAGNSGGDAGTGKGSSADNPLRSSGSIPTPAYPPLSEADGEQGTVVLEVLVAPGGQVKNVRVVRGSGYRRLDRAAVQGARNGHFHAQAWTAFTVAVKFTLD